MRLPLNCLGNLVSIQVWSLGSHTDPQLKTGQMAPFVSIGFHISKKWTILALNTEDCWKIKDTSSRDGTLEVFWLDLKTSL